MLLVFEELFVVFADMFFTSEKCALLCAKEIVKWNIKTILFLPQHANPTSIFLFVLFLIWKTENLSSVRFLLMFTLQSEALHHDEPWPNQSKTPSNSGVQCCIGRLLRKAQYLDQSLSTVSIETIAA